MTAATKKYILQNLVEIFICERRTKIINQVSLSKDNDLYSGISKVMQKKFTCQQLVKAPRLKVKFEVELFWLKLLL